MLTPATHPCQIGDLDYLYNNQKTLYRVVCRECGRWWAFILKPASEGNGKLVGFWNVSTVYPKSLFSNYEWLTLINNGLPHPKLPHDIAFEKTKRAEREALEDNPEYQYRQWRKEGGKLSRWNPNNA